MGIVAYCPSGHRIKVKDSLAGKKGHCPTCGAKFRIPQAAVVAGPAPGAPRLPTARIVPLDAARIAALPRALPMSMHEAPPAATPVADAMPELEVAEVVEEVGTSPQEEPASPWHPLLAEQPELAWCIAYPGGESSEPLPAEAVHQWLESRQATGAEVIWRADWPEWLPIASVFPEYLPPAEEQPPAWG
jgi:hypothetical protein